MYLLDTNIASAFIKDRHSLGDNKFLLQETEWAISSITHLELRFGMLSLPLADGRRRLISQFLFGAPVLDFDARASDAAAQVRIDLKRSGSQIGYYDPLIAGHALSLNAILVTANSKHFAHVQGLEIVNWLKP